ncbi:hypothetical protein [Namhaeicola litoreus]|uniref:Leucine-rich repeat domain-containing protein n=1 Tax=Namhaeicola litoreus TaxID=1052145 RepID=A0ABW3XZ21_9FLAO
MKKYFYLLTLSIFLVGSCEKEDDPIIDLSAEKQLPKIEVCHYDSDTDTWKTININENALKAHLKHGDYEGQCSDLVNVCHYDKETGTRETISVHENELAGHLDHGDYEGECKEGYTYVPDDPFEKELIRLGYDDVLDNYVLTSNINSVTQLLLGFYYYDENGNWTGISSNIVEDLTGIEDFKSLSHLQTATDKLTYIDLSQNINLKILGLEHYYSVDLKEIDLSKNINLEVLSLLNVPLKSIDLSNNVKLETLGLYQVPIESLDLSNNVNLIQIQLDNTRITELDLSNLFLLKFVGVWDDSYNLLSCIKVSSTVLGTATLTSSAASFSTYCGY